MAPGAAQGGSFDVDESGLGWPAASAPPEALASADWPAGASAPGGGSEPESSVHEPRITDRTKVARVARIEPPGPVRGGYFTEVRATATAVVLHRLSRTLAATSA